MRKTRKTQHSTMAIVYDWLDSWGGIERVLLQLKKLFPEADFFSSYIDLEKAPWAKQLAAQETWMGKLPSLLKRNRILSTPLYPFAFESLDLRAYSLVLSISSGFCKAVLTKPNATHVCLLLTPPRYLWSHRSQYLGSSILALLTQPVVSHLRQWDYIASQRPDCILSISSLVQERCTKAYGRTSEILHPPVDVAYWNSLGQGKTATAGQKTRKSYYLAVARLESYKKIDLLLDTFRRIPSKTLKIVGTGRMEKALRSKAPANVHFLGFVSDEKLAETYKRASALIMPQEEDFGLTSLEAQLFGCPVISFARSGTQDTILDSVTGLFFQEQTAESIVHAIEKFESISYTLWSKTSTKGPAHVRRFDVARFRDNLLRYINHYNNP